MKVSGLSTTMSGVGESVYLWKTRLAGRLGCFRTKALVDVDPSESCLGEGQVGLAEGKRRIKITGLSESDRWYDDGSGYAKTLKGEESVSKKDCSLGKDDDDDDI